MRETGGTFVADGYTNTAHNPLENFLVVTDKGPMFVDCVDTTGHVKDGPYICEQLKAAISKVGAENIVQLITDSAPNVKSGGEMLCKAAGCAMLHAFLWPIFHIIFHCLFLLLVFSVPHYI
jgi:hypothetical protein